MGYAGVKHIDNQDYSELIKQSLEMGGFPENTSKKEAFLMTGFGHNAVLGVADKVIDGVKTGAINHFFLIGGCDGAEGERSYFTQLAQQVPKDAVVLTLGCGKYRFNRLQEQFGDIAGIPRILDMGQCNDSYSAIQVALALKDAFGLKDVNELPLSLAVSWFEQKAVAVLLTLLSLNIRRIRLGPKLPGFATPNLVSALQSKFDLKIIGEAAEDAKLMMQKQ